MRTLYCLRLKESPFSLERLFMFPRIHIPDMPGTTNQEFPLITIGVIVFNREWIINEMLTSVQNQTYPQDKIFIVIVDGKSTDNTVKVAKEVLSNSNFSGYEVIVEQSTIPEARNLCIKNMKGDYLFFWDSDVIMELAALEGILNLLKKENADLVSVLPNYLFVNSVDEIQKKWPELEIKYRQNVTGPIDVTGAGCLLISKDVLAEIYFDPDMTFAEDIDFTSRATEAGFKLFETKNIVVINLKSDNPYSHIYFDMPIKTTLRGTRKKSAIQAQHITANYQWITNGFPPVSKAVARFFFSNKRYLFYVGYVPAIVLTVIGVLIQNLWVGLVFPMYFLVFTAFQCKKRGLFKGLYSGLRSLVVGIPTTYVLLYYFAKLAIKKPKRFTSKL